MAYPLATVLAEKLETVISRSVANTRPRDYYDIFTLWQTRKDTVDSDTLREALVATADKRGTLASMNNYREVMTMVAADSGMLGHWSAYARRYPYVGDLPFQDTCESVVEIMEAMSW